MQDHVHERVQVRGFKWVSPAKIKPTMTVACSAGAFHGKATATQWPSTKRMQRGGPPATHLVVISYSTHPRDQTSDLKS